MSILKYTQYIDDNSEGTLAFISRLVKQKDLPQAKIIDISVSTNDSVRNDVKLPLGINNSDFKSYWASKNCENQWYQIDLRSFKLHLTSFVYKAYTDDYFENWEMLGTNDMITWTTLYSGTKPETYNVLESRNYLCDSNIDESYSIFRMQTHGERNHQYKYNFAIYKLEFFGTLYSMNCICSHPMTKSFIHVFHFVFISLIK